MKKFDSKNESLNVSLQLSCVLRELQIIERVTENEDVGKASSYLQSAIKSIDTYITSNKK